jgi:hypothetical protein
MNGKLTRRKFIGSGLVATGGVAITGVPLQSVSGVEARGTKVISKEIFIEAPSDQVSVGANAFYSRSHGTDMMCVKSISSRSDTSDTISRRFSTDNGTTWTEWDPVSFIKKTPAGIQRRYEQPGWAVPGTERLLIMVLEGTLPTDNPLEGLKHWLLRYRVSLDGGRTSVVDEQVIQDGDFTPDHPLEGTWVGKNSFMIGASTCRPIQTRDGHFLVPVQVTPMGPDGEYHNPGGGYTYHEAAVLIGTWRENGHRVRWEVSERIANDPALSTRGCIEPTLSEMPDGRILMVMRGSNDVKPQLAGYKWYAVSNDGGRHWSQPKPWTFTDGSNFFSPSSCSQLLQRSDGRCYWLGNISPSNPKGNGPRYPLVIGEVDPKSLLLIENTVREIDTRQAGEDEDLQLSNFFAYEDRESGNIVLHVTRFFHRKRWRGDAYVFQIEAPNPH